MSDQDVFNQSNNEPAQATPETNAPNPNEAFKDQLAQFTNGAGEVKYKDVPTALGALQHSQTHISTLESDNQSLRQELDKWKTEAEQRKSVEEIVNNISNKQEQQYTQTTPQNTGLDEQRVAELVQSQLNQVQQQQLAQQNVADVSSFLSQRYGDKVQDVLATKAQELGTTVENLGKLSTEQPNLVKSLFSQVPAPTSNPSTSDVSTKLEPTQGELNLPKPEKSIMRGGLSWNSGISDHFAKSKQYTYEKLRQQGFNIPE